MATTSQTNRTAFRNHPTLPIAIVGGGLGGLALAVGLVKHGVNVQIFEGARAFSEIGAGVAFGLNAVKALHLIDPRLLKGYKKHATFDADLAHENTFYTVRWAVDQKEGPLHKAGDFEFRLDDIWQFDRTKEMDVKTRSCIHRARLLEELVVLLPGGITTFGKHFETARELADGCMELQFTDGTTALASAIVGCDGVKSQVRSLVCPTVQPRYAGTYALRAVVPRADAIALLGTDLTCNGQVYIAYGYYIITYPIENGDLVNMTACIHDPQNPQERKWEHSEWTVLATKSDLAEVSRGIYTPLARLFEQYMLQSKWALFVVQHNEPYFKDRICLLGDAAHATVPHLGAGAGMAMEDAYILSNLVSLAGNFKDIEQAFQAYDAVRRPRTQGCIRRSLQASLGEWLGAQKAGTNLSECRETMEESFRWLWHEDLEKQLEVAKGLMSSAGMFIRGEFSENFDTLVDYGVRHD